MFSEKKSSNSKKNIQEQNTITTGTKLTGDVVGDGNFRIEGFLEGTLKTKGKVVVSKTGKIVGVLECDSVDIAGEFDGEMKVADILKLKSSAKVFGTIKINRLEVDSGAIFNASCEMISNLKNVENGKKTA
ncbi:bactofilin family protein [Zunongwangia sp.]|uniref:bactofilin family protein n=1 Tax=Zunongwangia sp. TaxID=1965325 RepID=UPI003AA9127A